MRKPGDSGKESSPRQCEKETLRGTRLKKRTYEYEHQSNLCIHYCFNLKSIILKLSALR